MKVENKSNYKGFRKFVRYTFSSISEFVEYINNTPTNEAFSTSGKNAIRSDVISPDRTRFTGTQSFKKASDLLKYGWEEGGKRITQGLKDFSKIDCEEKVIKKVYDVVGFQASVPRYLQGIPTAMVNQKMVVQKQKVVTIVKNVGYNCNIKTETIINESIKALRLINKVEQQGIRCNLFIELCACEFGTCLSCRIKVKSSSERFSVVKYAFPLAHPSMLRRILFKWMEVIPECERHFVSTYGRSVYDIKRIANENEIVLNSFIDFDVDELKSFSDLQA